MMADGNDEPMPHAPAAVATAAMNNRCRYVPQLIEASSELSSTSSSNSVPPLETLNARLPTFASTAGPNSSFLSPIVPQNYIPLSPTKGAYPEVNNNHTNIITMASTPPLDCKARRHNLIPIETTFDPFRSHSNALKGNPHGPTAELTPDPSPISPVPPDLPAPIIPGSEQTTQHKIKRRFAPQLIETSRRTRRAGQQGPGVRLADKTDITPGTNHIYAPKLKRRLGALRQSTTDPLNRSDDGAGSRHLMPRRKNSLRPHRNTFSDWSYHCTKSLHPDLDTIDSSGLGSPSEENNVSKRPTHKLSTVPGIGAPPHTPSEGEPCSMGLEISGRDECCDEGSPGYLLAVAAQEAQRRRELDEVMAAFPNGGRAAGVEHFYVRDESGNQSPAKEQLVQHDPSVSTTQKPAEPGQATEKPQQPADEHNEICGRSEMSTDSDMDHADIAPPPEDPLWTTSNPRLSSQDSSFHVAKPSAKPEASDTHSGPFGNPYATYSKEKDDGEMRKMQKAAAPPMLGSKLVFRTCLSPKATRMEPDHPFDTNGHLKHSEERNRDPTGAKGLWRGYCVEASKDVPKPASPQPRLLATPTEPRSPLMPLIPGAIDPLEGTPTPRTPAPKTPGHTKGSVSLFALPTKLDDRLRNEKARKERDEIMLNEFNDAFVTQIYNYLSLGYPAMARAFDEELSKISGVPIEELRRADKNIKIEKGFMLHTELQARSQSRTSTDDGSNCCNELCSPEEDERKFGATPPRWKALRLYIREWARQHPDFGNDEDPSAWGARARRGSWAI